MGLPLTDFQPQHTIIEQYGDIIEILEYEKKPPSSRNTFTSIKKRIKKRKNNQFKFKSKRNIQRSYTSFRKKAINALYIQDNAPHFLTLTYAHNQTDLGIAYKHFTSFIGELKKIYPLLKYLAVPEFQKRGAVHFHVLIFNLRKDAHLAEIHTRQIQSYWGWGWVDIIATDGNPRIGSYMAKYMQKAMSDSRLFGRKAHTSSRGLLQKMRTNAPLAVAYLKREFGLNEPEKVIHNGQLTELEAYEKNTEWLGRGRFRRYRVKFQDHEIHSNEETGNQL